MKDKKEKKGIDLLQLLIGIERYYEYNEDDGIIYETRRIELYYQTQILQSDTVCRRRLINVTTGDEMMVDQNGKCLYACTKYRDILSVDDLKTLKDSIQVLIDTTESYIVSQKNGKETITYFKRLLRYMNKQERLGLPAYIEIDDIDYLAEMASNIYYLSYGDPFEEAQDAKRLFRVFNGGKQDEKDKH